MLALQSVNYDGSAAAMPFTACSDIPAVGV